MTRYPLIFHTITPCAHTVLPPLLLPLNPLLPPPTLPLLPPITAYRAAATPAALELANITADASLSKARMSALLVLCNKAGQDEVGVDKYADICGEISVLPTCCCSGQREVLTI